MIASPSAGPMVRRCGCVALVLGGGLLCGASALLATGPPDLVVPYTPEPIVVDGDSDPAWAAAQDIFFGLDIFSVVFRALHDDRTLYLYIDDLSDDSHMPGAGAAIWFDDEGGAAPLLADGAWTASACHVEANRGEGSLAWILASTSPVTLEERWTEMTSAPACGTAIGQNGSSAAIHFREAPYTGLATEVALPLDGLSALAATSGQRLGLYVQSYYAYGAGTLVVGQWPSIADGGSSDPSHQGVVALAELTCNMRREDFDPQFPVDWVATTSSGEGWLRSGVASCPVNATGGSGEAACVVRGTSTLGLDARLTSPWFSLRNAATASLTYRAIYRHAPTSDDLLDLEATTDGTTWAPALLSWTTTNHGLAGGEAVSVDLSSLAGQPRVQLRWRYAVPPEQAGYGAQIDVVGLRCGPSLFSDAYESGLLTHWNGQQP